MRWVGGEFELGGCGCILVSDAACVSLRQGGVKHMHDDRHLWAIRAVRKDAGLQKRARERLPISGPEAKETSRNCGPGLVTRQAGEQRLHGVRCVYAIQRGVAVAQDQGR